MKFSSMRWLYIVGALAVSAAAVVSSNVGCGGSDEAGGSGGAGGSGTGSGGSGGAVPARVAFTFNSGLETWALSDYIDGFPSKNLGAYMSPDAGLTLPAPPVLAHAATVGDPATPPGAMRVTVSFTGFNQYVDPTVNINNAPVDLTHRIVKARVRLVSGSFPGGVQLHISSGLTPPNDWVYVAQYLNGPFPLGEWREAQLNTDLVTPGDGRVFDAAVIVQIGIQITTGSAFDGGMPASECVFEIDTVQG
jgi:hypothetical protein